MHINFIKSHSTVSEINVFKTWHLKCELSNTARASSWLPKSRAISEHFTLQHDNAPAHQGGDFISQYSRLHRTMVVAIKLIGLESGRLRSVRCAPRTRVPLPCPDSRRWPSEAATYWRVESLWPEQCISGVFDCVHVFYQKEATLSTNCNQHCAADFPVLESWVFGVSI